MAWRTVSETSTLVTVWDDGTRRVIGWEPGAPDVLTVDRVYTAAENAAADARASTETSLTAAIAARENTRTAVRAIVADLQAEKARCDAILAKSAAQITGADTKEAARAAKRIADAAIDLARFVGDL